MRKRQRKKNLKARLKQSQENIVAFARLFSKAPFPPWLGSCYQFISARQEEAAQRAAQFFGLDPAWTGGDKAVAVSVCPCPDGSLTITEIYEAELYQNPFQEEPHEKADDLSSSGPGPVRL